VIDREYRLRPKDRSIEDLFGIDQDAARRFGWRLLG
jgi:hypothetical protein